MSEHIDFIMPQFKKIQRPHKQAKQPRVQDKRKTSTKSFEIEKSFTPQTVSQIHEKLRPEVNELKKFLKLKKERQRKQKQLIAEGLINKTEQAQASKQKVEKSEQNEKYKVDQSGNLRDDKGNLVFVKNQTTDLKINKKKQQQLQTKQLNKKQKIKFHDRLSKSFLDRNLALSGAKKRIRRSMLGLQFLEQGSYQPYTATKIKIEDEDLDQVAKNQLSTPKVIKKRFQTKLQFSRDVPKCQWWDLEIINQQAYDVLLQKQNKKQSVNFQQILNIEKLNKEVTFQKVGEQQKREQKINIPLYLTKDERKKLKRKRKKQRLMEKNDMIRLGLIQPEKPKLKISNMAIVLKDQFIMDPSKVEAEAKKQQEQRLNKHLQANAERKLTKSQKKQKVMRKLKKDSAKECRRIVFKLNHLNDQSHIFKVNMNAKQLALNGFILKPAQYHNQPVIVMAQGGEKAIRFYRNLMINRIKWNEKDDNECKIIWQGQIESSKLGKWRTIQVGDQSQTIRALAERGVENFRQYIS